MNVRAEQINTRLAGLAVVTNRAVTTALADLLPAGHHIQIWEPTARNGLTTQSWIIQGGPPGDSFHRAAPVVRGQSGRILADLINAAWEVAGTTETAAELNARAAASVAALPICPECGHTVLPHEAAVAAVAGHHRDCA
jgi:hypothetical protein